MAEIMPWDFFVNVLCQKFGNSIFSSYLSDVIKKEKRIWKASMRGNYP